MSRRSRQAAQFSWKRFIDQTLDAYRSALPEEGTALSLPTRTAA
jgi:hypothetical protein